MGTDIHLEVETKPGEVWERLPHLPQQCTSCAEWDPVEKEYGEPKGFFYPWVDVDELDSYIAQGYSPLSEPNQSGRVRISERRECYTCKGTKITYPQIYHDRNYDVFGVLADVRNGTGFAGIDTGEGFVPIDEPRGLPDDLSPQLLAHLERLGYAVEDGRLEDNGRRPQAEAYDKMEEEPEGYWSLGDHSFSWLTLREVLEYDYSRSTKKRGWVDPWNFELYRRRGAPSSWSGGITGRNVEHISPQQMGRMIDEGNIQFKGDDADWQHPDFMDREYTTGLSRAMSQWDLPEGSTGAAIRDGQSYYCLIEWDAPYLDSLKWFVKQMEALREHAPDGDLDRIRLVFGFDS
ncbi:MAG TPA: hypothetical protein VLA89_16575 [Gemmatimonadales bacterium]|nr:hypothetical protein [Gemmatimonadales bacterium]